MGHSTFVRGWFPSQNRFATTYPKTCCVPFPFCDKSFPRRRESSGVREMTGLLRGNDVELERKGTQESAGINQIGVGNERVLQMTYPSVPLRSSWDRLLFVRCDRMRTWIPFTSKRQSSVTRPHGRAKSRLLRSCRTKRDVGSNRKHRSTNW